MKKLFFLSFIICLYFCSCNSGSVSQHTGADTAQIITQVFNSKKLSEGIPPGIDTVYLIKSKKFSYYNPSWPRSINKLKVIYLDDIPQNTEGLDRTSKITDKPLRYLINKFSIKTDSVNISVYGINQRTEYNYRLIRKNANWQIIWSGWGID